VGEPNLNLKSESLAYLTVVRQRKTRYFSAVRNVADGTSHHFAATRQLRRFRAEEDIGPDFMSTRPN